MRHLLRPTDFTTEEIEELICIAEEIEENPEKFAHVADGKSWRLVFMSQVPVRD